jgi:2-hydroxychromene-2-carboxylate isomerase
MPVMSSETFDPLASAAPLIVYIDYKSPYAYLAIDPTYAIEDELGIEVDWRPFTLV